MNSDFSSAELLAMQREAEQRVYEMQRRARKTLEYDDESFPPEPEKTEETPLPKEKSGGIDGLIELLGKDNERSLILLLLVVLINEDADNELILALLYLLL